MSKNDEPTSDMDFTDADWESAAEEVRAAGHRVDRTDEGYDLYPYGKPDDCGLPSMQFKRQGADPKGSLEDFRKVKNMRENPSRFKEGDRVTFNPNPAALQMYTAGTYPPIGTSGSVTTVSVPGGGRRTTMPGPRGGMLYVKWDGYGTVGVFPVDVVREGRRQNPSRLGVLDGTYGDDAPTSGYEKYGSDDVNPEYKWFVVDANWNILAGNEYKSDAQDVQKEEPGSKVYAAQTLINKGYDPYDWSNWREHKSPVGPGVADVEIPHDVALGMMDWHGGQGDPIYAVASSALAGRPVARALLERAVAALWSMTGKAKKGADSQHLHSLISELESL